MKAASIEDRVERAFDILRGERTVKESCMSTDNGSSPSRSPVVDHVRLAPSPSLARKRIDADRSARKPQRRPVDSARVPNPARREETLPRNEFLKALQREKRRSERSAAALSLVVYRTDDDEGHEAPQCGDLLEALHAAKRENDVLGEIGDGLIAVLCPDTDERGIEGFMRKIAARSEAQPFAPVAATFPDQLFEALCNGTRLQLAFQPLLLMDAGPAPPRGYPLKRCLDIAGALAALILLGPLMLVVAAAIQLGSPGPVIFTQRRLGLGGAPFTFYKFRSMVMHADDTVHRDFVADLIRGGNVEAGAAPAEAPYKLHADPRITRVGRLIRKTSIDELPQLFNVLRGDMSLVGPRPPIPYETAHYRPWHLRRVLSLKPGITGLWQVEGRSRVSFDEMVRMDLRYVRSCSLALDLRLLLRTVLVVIRCQGAL